MSEIIENGPMTVGKIFDKAVDFIFKNIVWITLIGLLVALPEFIFEEWLVPEESVPFGMVKHKLALRLISMILSPLFGGMVAVLLAEQFFGRKMAWYVGFMQSFKKWYSLIFLTIFIIIAASLGTLLLIIPGIIVLCATTCAIPAMMLENLGPMKAFDRSWNLTKKNRSRIFGYLMLSGIINIIAFGILSGIILVVPLDPLYKIGLSALIVAPLHALGPAIATLLFLDLRIRKEAMDLENEAKATLLTVAQ